VENYPSAGSRRGAVLLHVCVFGALVLLAGLVLWWKVWVTGHPAGTITCQCGDASQELWFLSWTPYALSHGHDPFLTNAIFAGRGGANMLANTSWIFPSLLLAPVTSLFGPIASFNVGAVLGPAVSGWAFFLASRKVSGFLPGQLLGSLLYGLSPFVLWNDPIGHLDFVLLFFAPLALVLVYDLAVTSKHRPWRVGLLLGLLVVVQFFTSTEFLAICAVTGALAVVVAVAIAPRRAWERRRPIFVGLATASGVTAALLAYPMWFLLEGPRHIVGPPWPGSPSMGATASAIVDAGHAVHAASFFDKISGYFGGAGPNFGPNDFPSLIFLGIPLLVLLGMSAFVWWRTGLAWVLALGGTAAWLFSLGTTMGTEFDPPARVSHPSWLPWRPLSHLPLLSQIEPLRFAAVVTFSAALLLVVSLAGWERLLRRFAPPLAIWIALGAAGSAVLVPVALTASVPFVVRSTPVPAWFERAAPRLDPSTVVLTVPFGDQEAMGWQAETGFPVRLAGGFAVVPGAGGRSQFVVPPAGAAGLLDRLSPGVDAIATRPLPTSEADVVTVREALERWRVGVVVVTPEARSVQYVTGFMTAVMGRAPVLEDGSWTWSGLGTDPPAVVGPDTLTACAREANASPVTVALCVLGPAR